MHDNAKIDPRVSPLERTIRNVRGHLALFDGISRIVTTEHGTHATTLLYDFDEIASEARVANELRGAVSQRNSQIENQAAVIVHQRQAIERQANEIDDLRVQVQQLSDEAKQEAATTPCLVEMANELMGSTTRFGHRVSHVALEDTGGNCVTMSKAQQFHRTATEYDDADDEDFSMHLDSVVRYDDKKSEAAPTPEPEDDAVDGPLYRANGRTYSDRAINLAGSLATTKYPTTEVPLILEIVQDVIDAEAAAAKRAPVEVKRDVLESALNAAGVDLGEFYDHNPMGRRAVAATATGAKVMGAQFGRFHPDSINEVLKASEAEEGLTFRDIDGDGTPDIVVLEFPIPVGWELVRKIDEGERIRR